MVIADGQARAQVVKVTKTTLKMSSARSEERDR